MNGCALEGEKKYDEAIQAFTAAGDYQDAAEKLRNVIIMMRLTRWQQAIILMQKIYL